MTEFDTYAEEYERILAPISKVSGFDHAYFHEYKIKEVHDFVGSHTAAEKEITFLNFGCGIGKSEKFIRKYFKHAHIYSIDPSKRSIEIAKEHNRKLVNVVFRTFDGYRIPFENKFDIIFIANVLHHVSRADHLQLLENLYRKLDDQGHLFVFEHNPFNPITLKIVRSCTLDEKAVLLSPLYLNRILATIGFTWRKIRFRLFFPKRLSFLVFLEYYLGKVPLGAQYYVVAKKYA